MATVRATMGRLCHWLRLGLGFELGSGSPFGRQPTVRGRGSLRIGSAWLAVCVSLLFLLLGHARPLSAQELGGAEAPIAERGTTPDAPAMPTEPEAPETDEERAQLKELESERGQLALDAKAWRQKAASYAEVQAGASAMLERIADEIQQLKAREPNAIAKEEAIERLETSLLGVEQDLLLSRQQEAELELEEASRSGRRKQLPELLIAAKQRLQAMGDLPSAKEGETALERASRAVDEAARENLTAEISAYEIELESFDVRGQLLQKRIDRVAARIAFEEASRDALQSVLADRQDAEARAAVLHARESFVEVEALPEVVKEFARELAEQNAALADERIGQGSLTSRIEEVRKKLGRADARLAQLEIDFQRLTRKIEAVGLNDSVGLLLRKQRSEVPDVGKYRRFIRMRQELISSVQIELIERMDERRALSDVDAVLSRSMQQIDDSVPLADRPAIEELLRDLLETKRTYLDALIGDYEVYFQNLVDFDARQQQLIEKTEQLLLFIDERVLWIPSGGVFRATLPVDLVGAVGWLLDPRFVKQLWNATSAAAMRSPLVTALFLLFAGTFWPIRKRIARRIEELATVAREPTCDRIGPTWVAVGFSLLLAAWLPLLLYFFGWQLSVSGDATLYVRSVAHGLTSAAVLWLTLEVSRQLLRRDGLAEAHLAAPSEAVLALWKQFRWLIAVAVPAVFLIQVFEARAEDTWREAIGRLTFVSLMFAVGFFTHSAMREGSGSIRRIVAGVPELSLRPIAWSAARLGLIGGAALLTVAALRGYYWTALQLAESLHFSFVFGFLLAALFMLFIRWSLVARRHVVFERLRKRQEAEGEGSAEGEGAGDDAELDLGVADAQTARLLKSAAFVALLMGLFVIWADLFPAAGILREVELWDATQSVSVELTNAGGETRFTEQDRIVPVTLADLVLAALIGILTLIVVRNLPGVLEITVLSRLGAGERYAYALLAKYGVTVLGVVVAFNTIGIGWSSIQWLVAAVGLGLGFGLQEIFANFVSGLIILFERPLRVGDTVTVGDVSGVVSRVRIRATWITGFDRKELVVPNKEFVTNRLINWSLTDAVLRVDIPVGIAYGSDTEQAIEVLRRVALANRDVLREPPPDVLFLGFGDSALDFELRAFSPDVEHRIKIQHALHMAIDKAFREAGIEIAFPQRDLHVRSLPAPLPNPDV